MPEATVGAVITKTEENQEKILLTLRRYPPFKGFWCIPGGHIDKNETAESAVIREVGEETGLKFSGRFFGFFEEIFPDLDIHNIALMYAGSAEGRLENETDEVVASDWFTPDEAVEMDLAFTHRDVIAAYIKQKSE